MTSRSSRGERVLAGPELPFPSDLRDRKRTQRHAMNRWWLAGCGVALTVWVVVALLVVFFGMILRPRIPLMGG